MNIITFFKSFGSVLLPMLVLDGIWITSMNAPFYQKYLGHLMGKHPVWIAAIVFYVVYAAGTAYLVVAPALAQGLSWHAVALRGAALGLMAYATYDLTNLATISNWSVVLTVVDMAWGTVITAAASVIGYLILK